jgi:hypothetical protein
VVWGGLMLVNAFLRGGPQGSGSYAAVQTARHSPGEPNLKISLTVGQIVHLLCIGGRGILLSVQSVNGYAHMNSTDLITRVAQGFLAITATGVSVLLLQFAMVA